MPTKSMERNVGAKLSPVEYGKLNNIVKAGFYLNVSDFIRDAIREKLEAIEVIKTREISFSQAKKEVLGYYKKYSEAFPSDVANDLELDYELVSSITDELKKEKRLEVMK